MYQRLRTVERLLATDLEARRPAHRAPRGSHGTRRAARRLTRDPGAAEGGDTPGPGPHTLRLAGVPLVFRWTMIHRRTSKRACAGGVGGRMAVMTYEGSSIDPAKPSIARVYDYLLGGKDNYAVDREIGDVFKRDLPGSVAIAFANRTALTRAVGEIAKTTGIRQFVDLGSGLPTADNVHQVAQRHAPEVPGRLRRHRPPSPRPRQGVAGERRPDPRRRGRCTQSRRRPHPPRHARADRLHSSRRRHLQRHPPPRQR